VIDREAERIAHDRLHRDADDMTALDAPEENLVTGWDPQTVV
jgi:hypothetical protein